VAGARELGAPEDAQTENTPVTPAPLKKPTSIEDWRPVANAASAPPAIAAPHAAVDGPDTRFADSPAAKSPQAAAAPDDSDTKEAPTPSMQTAAGPAPAKTNVKSQESSKSAARPKQPTEANGNVIAAATIPGQAPAPFFAPIRLPFWHADAVPDQTSETSASLAQPQTTASGFQPAGTAAAPPDAPGGSGQQTVEEGMRGFKATPTAGVAGPGSNVLAFAAKVQPNAAASQPSLDTSGRSIAEAPVITTPAMRKPTPDAESQRASESPEIVMPVNNNVPITNAGNVPVSNVTTTLHQQDSPTPSPSPKADSPIEPAASLQVSQPAQSSAKVLPLKDVSLRIEQPQGQNVEVRVVERAGEVRVAVRGGDSDVIQGLRQNLAELTERLSESGFHTETWRPDAPSAPSESKSSSGYPGGGDSQPQQNWSQQGRGQRDQDQPNRPPWVQEFETSLNSGAAPTGSFDGLIR
jgi:hypothetical protein